MRKIIHNSQNSNLKNKIDFGVILKDKSNLRRMSLRQKSRYRKEKAGKRE
jgi:hypothetical protein